MKTLAISLLLALCAASWLSAGQCPYFTYQNIHCKIGDCDTWIAVAVCNGPYGNSKQCGASNQINCCGNQLQNFGDGNPCSSAAVDGKTTPCAAPSPLAPPAPTPKPAERAGKTKADA